MSHLGYWTQEKIQDSWLRHFSQLLRLWQTGENLNFHYGARVPIIPSPKKEQHIVQSSSFNSNSWWATDVHSLVTCIESPSENPDWWTSLKFVFSERLCRPECFWPWMIRSQWASWCLETPMMLWRWTWPRLSLSPAPSDVPTCMFQFWRTKSCTYHCALKNALINIKP